MKTTVGTSQDELRAAARPRVAKEPLAVGVYETTPRFRAVAEHACVVTADNRAVVAVTGKAGDAESEVYAELFAAAPDLLEACRAMEAVDDHIAECEDGCGDGQSPEACEVGFPLADRARQLRCAAILKATGSI